jgi:23S rRNA (uracil1939-C5)-methyltransferase
MSTPIKNGDIIELLIDRISFTGKGIGRYDNFVIFIPQSIPGDLVRAQITTVKRKYADARVVEFIKRSDLAIEPKCRHFGICGGCSFQNLGYDDQLAAKQDAIHQHLSRIGKIDDPPIESAVGAEDQFFYRNKMEFSFKPDDRNFLRLGLHHRGDWNNIFDLQECFLQSEISNGIVAAVRNFFGTRGIPAYHLSEHHGYLRFLIIRESKSSGEVMLILVTSSGTYDYKDEFVNMIRKSFPQVVSIAHVINTTKGNVATGKFKEFMWGREFIIEKICGKDFKIGPTTFFQTNSRQTEKLYEKISELAGFQSADEVLDLYTGCGTIAIHIAAMVRSVLGVELNRDAVRSAEENAGLNGADNCEFIAGDALKVLNEIIENQPQRFGTIIVDPPRAGIGKKVVKRIIRLEPRRIIYVSCNPATLAEDLKDLLAADYSLDRIVPVDMFPHTFHIESVSRLTKK